MGLSLRMDSSLASGVAAKASGRQPTYYFSAAGSDSNDGRTINTPKQTITAFNGLTLTATDYVAFRKGDTFVGAMVIGQSGSALSSIIIGSYGVGAAPIIAPPAGSNGLFADNQSYLTVQNLTFTGADTTAAAGAAGVLIQADSASISTVIVQNCTASGFGDSGISFSAITTGRMDTIKVLNCTAFGNAIGTNSFTCGIWIGGNGAQNTNYYPITNFVVDSCIVHDNTGHNGTANWCGSGIKVGSANVGVVQNCIAYNNGSLCNLAAGGPTGIWVSVAKSVTIQFCESYLNTGINGDGCGFDMDGGCDNCICQYNYSHDNDGSGFMDFVYDSASLTGNHGNIIRFNISSNDSKKWNGAIQIASSNATAIVGSQCYGNTIFTKGAQAVACMKVYKGGTAGLTATIANNIFVSENPNAKLVFTNATNPSSATFAGNNYYNISTFAIEWNGTTYSSVAAWQTATGQEKIAGVNVSQNVEPKTYYFGSTIAGDASGARLTVASALLNTGVNLLTNFSIDPGTRDYFGGAVSSAGPYSVGCSWAGSALTTIYLTTTGAGVQTIPADFAAFFSAETIAAGGGTGTGGVNGPGGGGGYSKITATSTPLSPGAQINYGVGAGNSAAAGGDTWWNATSLANAVTLGSAVAVASQGGGANVGATGGLGGTATNGVGTTKYSGGNGGNNGSGTNGGGAGAAGPFGNGGNGGAGGAAGVAAGSGGGGGGGANAANASASSSTAGGNSWYGVGGGAGSSGSGNAGSRGGGGSGAASTGGTGGNGGNGIEWDSTHGSGGGAGSALGNSTLAPAGLYGAGSGGRNTNFGAQGIIRFAYKTAGVV